MTDSGLAKASTELSLWSKLEGPLHRSLVQTLPNISTVRAKAMVTSELSLFSKFRRITTLVLERGATADGNGQKVTCTSKFVLTAPIPGKRRWQHDNRLLSRP